MSFLLILLVFLSTHVTCDIRSRKPGEIVPLGVEHSGTYDNDEVFYAADHAIDLVFDTMSKTSADSGSKVWLNITLAQVYCISEVVEYEDDKDVQYSWHCSESSCPCNEGTGFECRNFLLTVSIQGTSTSYFPPDTSCKCGDTVTLERTNSGVFGVSEIAVIGKVVGVQGGWSDFGGWTDCTRECGGGTHFRTRSCDNPAPQLGGRGCEGDAVEIQECNPQPCSVAVDGEWGNSVDWSRDCLKECDDTFVVPRVAVWSGIGILLFVLLLLAVMLFKNLCSSPVELEHMYIDNTVQTPELTTLPSKTHPATSYKSANEAEDYCCDMEVSKL